MESNRGGSPDLEDSLRAVFIASPEDIVAVYVLGSQARGTATSLSDIDVTVLYATAPPVSFQGLPRHASYGRVQGHRRSRL